jgi:diphthine synthase
MGELLFLGLGLHDDTDLSLKALEAARTCDRLLLDTYTSILPGLDRRRLAAAVGRDVEPAGRAEVETATAILEAAASGRLGLFVPGDPMTATTHVDLRLRAHQRGIATRIFHGASILTAAAGLLGLQAYKFGPTVTVPRPLPSYRPSSPYERLAENRRRGQHTLALLDTSDGRNPLTAGEALAYLVSLEGEFRSGACAPGSLVGVVARAGSAAPAVAAGPVAELMGRDFGGPPHTLVFPGNLHFAETEALRAFAGYRGR